MNIKRKDVNELEKRKIVELINPKAIFEKYINSRKLVTSFKIKIGRENTDKQKREWEWGSNYKEKF